MKAYSLFATLSAIYTLSITPQSFAYLETMNNANVVKNGTLRAMVSSQLGLSRHNGLNINGLADVGLSEDSDLRFSFGLGKVNFAFAGLYKWAPIPDVDKQPAMAIISGVSYANIAGSNEFSIQLQPLLSKGFDSRWGYFTPHVALPVAIMSRSGKTVYPLHFAVGTEFIPVDFKWENVRFMTELILNLNESFTSVSIAAIFTFENLTAIKILKKH